MRRAKFKLTANGHPHKTMSAAAYKPSATRTSDDTIASFITSELEVSVTSVPGIGPGNAEKLRGVGISSTHQLLGKFLSFKGEVWPCPCALVLLFISSLYV